MQFKVICDVGGIGIIVVSLLYAFLKRRKIDL